jgi:hypothetical protein
MVTLAHPRRVFPYYNRLQLPIPETASFARCIRLGFDQSPSDVERGESESGYVRLCGLCNGILAGLTAGAGLGQLFIGSGRRGVARCAPGWGAPFRACGLLGRCC